MPKIYLYTRFERFWHWLQAIIIFILLCTGFEVHGVYTLIGFDRAVQLHNFFGFSWVVLFVFIIFWVFTTGEWRQYIPTTQKLWEVVRYYTSGIFQGKPHPVQKSKESKHNPLQRLTYLALTAVLLTIQMGTGLLYYLYNDWAIWGISFLSLRAIAFIHLVCAFGILSFVIIHIYMTTTGHTITSHITAMITGWEEGEESDIPEWERPAKR